MERVLISQLKDKDQVSNVFLVREKIINLGKNGRPFMSLLLGDQSGSMDAKVWDNIDELKNEFDIGDLVKTKGVVQIYQARKQLIVHKIEKYNESEFSREDFLVQSSHKPEDQMAELITIIKTMKSDFLRQLCLDVIEDPEIRPLLLRAPAAKSIHHAWVGGLLEHIVSIAKIMNFMAEHYKYLNRDLLIFGALFHDIGKVWELSSDNGIAYTDRGRLIGHMEMGCELIDRKSQKIMGFPAELRDLCKHIVLSHHGKLEYGSPKRPKFIEAYLVSMIDELDSKMSALEQFISNERQNTTERWSRLNDQFERYFILDNLKDKF